MVIRSPLPFILAAILAAAQPAPAAGHPLDPLSYREFWRVLELLRDAGHMDRKTRFSQLTLQEPPKREVLAWRPGAGMPRKAYAVVRRGEKAFEAVVDLTADRIASWSPLKEVHPNWIEDDFKAMVDKVLEHPDFVPYMGNRRPTPTADSWIATSWR